MSAESIKVSAAAIYARVSSEDQVSGTSLDDQVDKCLKQAAVYGWAVPSERIYIDDGYSGSNLDRPAMARLRAAVADGSVDCVLVFKLDRLSRNIRDTVNLVLEEWSKQHKVVFRSVTEDFNTNSPLGTLIFSILASFAHFERDVIRDRTENGRRRRFIQGRRAVGDPPYGYSRGAVAGTMVVIPEQAEVVRKIYHLYLQGHGFMRIATMLNQAGYRTSAGNEWTDKTVRDVATNGVYTGKVKYSQEYLPGHQEPIVGEEVFAAVQEVRGARGRISGRSVGTAFLLAGLARCKGCGHLLYTQPATESRRKRKDGSAYITRNQAYYQCGGRLKRGAGFCGCGHIQQELLEEHVVGRIRERFGGLVAEARSVQALRDEADAQGRELAESLRRLEAAVAEKRLAIERWETAFERGELSAGRFGARVERLEAEIVALEQQQTDTQAELAALREKQIDVDWIREVSHQVDSWAILPALVRKQLTTYLIDQIRVWKPGLGRGQHKESGEIEVDIVWNRNDRALPPGDLDGAALESPPRTAGSAGSAG
ncbi:MAG TPA: recombinase family protein [Symbiobacteriaceae bacterium]